MKKPPTKRDRILDVEISTLHDRNEDLRERTKLLEKRIDFVTDAQARLAIEMETLIKSVRFIIEVGQKLMDAKITEDQERSAKNKPKEDAGIS